MNKCAMNKERIEKLNSFLEEIKDFDLNGKTIKSFTIEKFEEEQRNIKNKKKREGK